mmetsp:Transcript_52351/g.59840  ORF Transcript_52351/g.59840 Transcript_52351/m.59840 type:complete len:88 (-) Transcript_52351:70-333(-)
MAMEVVTVIEVESRKKSLFERKLHPLSRLKILQLRHCELYVKENIKHKSEGRFHFISLFLASPKDWFVSHLSYNRTRTLQTQNFMAS